MPKRGSGLLASAQANLIENRAETSISSPNKKNHSMKNVVVALRCEDEAV